MSNYQSNELAALSQTFHALSNPNRLCLYLQIADADRLQQENSMPHGCCVGDLAEPLNISLSTLSHHIRELQRAGLIDTQRNGRHIHCRINPDMLQRLADFLHFVQAE